MSLELFPNLKPVPGLVFEAYMSRADVGSGRRMFVVLRVGHKWIHLFYAPQLISFKMRRGEFSALFMAPLTRFASGPFRARVRARMNQYDQYNIRYSKAVCEQVLALTMTCGLELFRKGMRQC